MKKTLLLLIIFSYTSLHVFAQSKTTVGIQAGLSSSSIKGDAAESLNQFINYADGRITTQSKTGVYGGISADIPLSSEFSIEPGIHYMQRGYEMRGEMQIKGAEFLSPNARAALTSHYIDMPVLLKANMSGLQLFLGPQVSYLASADLRTTAGVAGFNFYKNTFDATEQFNRWDAGVKGGIGYQFENGVNITASYDHGLMRADANKNMDAYNRSLKVGLGYRF